jgi:hypothetical protein
MSHDHPNLMVLPAHLIVEMGGNLVEHATAVFDPARTYRYALTRVWATAAPTALFVMLNPSTADHYHNDPTITRCLAFARSWGCGGLAVVNLYGLRATNPVALLHHPDPVGPDNDLVIASMLGSQPYGPVVAAWGARGRAGGRSARMVELLHARRVHPMCFGVTMSGEPQHPLYLKADTRLVDLPEDPHA